MLEWTPYFLLGLSGIGAVIWFVVRKFGAKLDRNTTQLDKLDGVAVHIAAVSSNVKNLESLVKDELRHFDVRITRLEARSEVRQETR
jgi:hypothetical protein